MSVAMDGIELIAAERERQVTGEGWTPEHDDLHTRGELSKAGGCYAAEALRPPGESRRRYSPYGWPWASSWWKPTGDPIRDLAKAGALIAAEIDRLQRAGEATER